MDEVVGFWIPASAGMTVGVGRMFAVRPGHRERTILSGLHYLGTTVGWDWWRQSDGLVEGVEWG